MTELRRITEQYHLEKLVHSSPGGSVFRATDLRSSEVVAVQLLSEVADEDSAEPRESFLRAAEALRAVAHATLPRLLDFGFTTAGSAFLVYEYLHGTPLPANFTAPPPRVLALFLPVALGLGALAKANLAHGNLKAEKLLIVPGERGKQVKILGIGGAALRAAGDPGQFAAGRRADLAAFARLVAGALGVALPEGAAGLILPPMPPTTTADIDQPEALQSLLNAALAAGSAAAPQAIEPPSWAEVAAVLRLCLGNRAAPLPPPPPAATAPPSGLRIAPADADGTLVLPIHPAASPPPREPASPASAAAEPAAMPSLLDQTADFSTRHRGPQRRRSPGPLMAKIAAMAAIVVGVAVLCIAGYLLFRRPGGTAPQGGEPPASPVSPPAAASVQLTPQAVQPATPTGAPPLAPVPTGLTPGAAAVPAVAGEPAGAPPPAILPTLTPTPLSLLDARRLAELHAAIDSGDVARLRAAAAAFPPIDRAGLLPASAKSELARARKVVASADLLAQAERGDRPAEVIRHARTLLGLLPRSPHVREVRDKAAAGLEAAAEAATAAGNNQEALRQLTALKEVWPDRPGLKEKIGRVEADAREDRRYETVLAHALQEAEARRPLVGLEILSHAQPNRRFDDRLKAARAKLTALTTELDRGAPAIARRSPFPQDYEKDSTWKLPLRISDDLEVMHTELWVRPEGGTFTAVPLRRLAGDDYEAEITPQIHQNKTVEFFAAALDHSGHQGGLGSAKEPQKIKLRSWLKKLFGGRREDEKAATPPP